MKRMVACVVPLALACLPSATFAQATAKPPKEKRVCRSAASIGTLVPQRTCHTPTEWKDIDGANDKAMQQMRIETAPGTQNPSG